MTNKLCEEVPEVARRQCRDMNLSDADMHHGLGQDYTPEAIDACIEWVKDNPKPIDSEPTPVADGETPWTAPELEPEPPARTSKLVCGRCAEFIHKAGGDRDESVTEISYGQSCEVHPTDVARAAIVAMHLPEDFAGVPAPEGWGQLFPRSNDFWTDPSTVGHRGRERLKIAVALLASWTRDERMVDDVLAVHALESADLLLSKAGAP